jgi:hypothetical protein
MPKVPTMCMASGKPSSRPFAHAFSWPRRWISTADDYRQQLVARGEIGGFQPRGVVGILRLLAPGLEIDERGAPTWRVAPDSARASPNQPSPYPPARFSLHGEGFILI